MDQSRGFPTLDRRVWTVAALLAVLVLVVALVVVAVSRGSYDPADCTATVGERTVELTSEQAVSASTIAARSVRDRESLATTSTTIATSLELGANEAQVVATTLTGRAPHAFTCRNGGSSVEDSDTLDTAGLTPRAVRLRRALDAAFGSQRVGGFAPGGVSTGHIPGSAHYEGRALDVFFRPPNRANRITGWAVSQYAVAQAERFAIDTVIYDDWIWTARRAGEGWRPYEIDTTGRSKRVAAILEHRDHVHIDVAD